MTVKFIRVRGVRSYKPGVLCGLDCQRLDAPETGQ